MYHLQPKGSPLRRERILCQDIDIAIPTMCQSSTMRHDTTLPLDLSLFDIPSSLRRRGSRVLLGGGFCGYVPALLYEPTSYFIIHESTSNLIAVEHLVSATRKMHAILTRFYGRKASLLDVTHGSIFVCAVKECLRGCATDDSSWTWPGLDLAGFIQVLQSAGYQKELVLMIVCLGDFASFCC